MRYANSFTFHISIRFCQVAEEVEELSNKRDKADSQVNDAKRNVAAAEKRADEKKAEWHESLEGNAPLKAEMEALEDKYTNVRREKDRLAKKKEAFLAKSKEGQDLIATKKQELKRVLDEAVKRAPTNPFADKDHEYRKPKIIIK